MNLRAFNHFFFFDDKSKKEFFSLSHKNLRMAKESVFIAIPMKKIS